MPARWGQGAIAAVALACTGPEVSVGVLGSTGPADPAGSTAVDLGPATTAETSTPSSDEGLKLDVGAHTDGVEEAGDGQGCTKADFLFVIDNSGSMEDEQDHLIAS